MKRNIVANVYFWWLHYFTYVLNHNYIGTRTLSKPFVICHWWDDRYKSQIESRWICIFQHNIQRLLYYAVSYLWVVIMLTHVPWYRMWVPEWGHLWFMPWLVAFSASSHWLNRLWLLITHNLCSILQWNRIKLTIIDEITLKVCICNFNTILSSEQWINDSYLNGLKHMCVNLNMYTCIYMHLYVEVYPITNSKKEICKRVESFVSICIK